MITFKYILAYFRRRFTLNFVEKTAINIFMKNLYFKILFFFLFSLVLQIEQVVFASDKIQINIAAASDMKFALEELKTKFEETTPNTNVGLTMGSSGKFFEQISNGAPFDLFFSADIEFPKKLKSAGIGSDVISYAFGRIAVWTLKNKAIEITELKNIVYKKIAIANPMHAPYGNRAIEALKKIGIHETIKDRLVLGENVSQAAQFVETGAADAGIVALSLVMAPNLKGKGSFTIISEKLHSPLEQGFILLKKENTAAVKFMHFMKTEEAKTILAKYGFTIPKN
jgi:molybdate transport system substrate-binding protein